MLASYPVSGEPPSSSCHQKPLMVDLQSCSTWWAAVYAVLPDPAPSSLEYPSASRSGPRSVQWIRLHAPNAGGPGSFPGQGPRSHMHHRNSQPSHVTALRGPPPHRPLRRTPRHQLAFSSSSEQWDQELAAQSPSSEENDTMWDVVNCGSRPERSAPLPHGLRLVLLRNLAYGAQQRLTSI